MLILKNVTLPGIEPPSPGLLANTLHTRSNARFYNTNNECQNTK